MLPFAVCRSTLVSSPAATRPLVILAVGDFARGDVAECVQLGELVVRARHRCGERHARLLHVGFGGLFLRHGLTQTLAVLAPQVQIPRRAGQHVVFAIPGAAVRRRVERV
jgi:hypothetical protein